MSLLSNAQKIDSLKKILNYAGGTDKYETLYGLAYEYSDVNDSLSLVYASQAFDIAMKLSDSARIVKAGRIRSAELRRLENFDQAIQIGQKMLNIARRHEYTPEIKSLLNSLANSHFLKAEYDKALKYHFESLVIRETEGNKGEISIALSNIGVVYYKLGDYNKAIEYYKKSLELKNQVKDKFALDKLLINIGLCFNSMGNYKEAKKYINEGLNLCAGKCSNQIILEGEIALGVSLLETNSPDESLIHFEKSYEVAKQLGNSRFQAENLISFARVYLIRKDYKTTLKNLIEAERISQEKGYRFLLVRIYELFSKLYEQTDNFKNTALYQSKYIKLKDSILSEKVISNLAQVRTEYEERENIKTIAKKDQVLALQNEIIVRQQRQNYFITAITGLVVVLAFLMYYFTKRQQNANREISSAKNLIQEQNERLERYNRELEDKVNERTKDLLKSNKSLKKVVDELDNFIYKCSHDLRGPLLTMKGVCNLAVVDIKDPVAADYFKKFDVTADKLNVILTRLLMVKYVNNSELKPEPIDFRLMIEEILNFERKKGILDPYKITSDVPEDCAIISDRFLVNTIVENLIDNAIKFHSRSTRTTPIVDIKLSRADDRVKLTVEDNGIGIDNRFTDDLFKMFIRASEDSEIGGVGLYLVKIAIDKLGGEVSLLSTSSEGSTFQVLFPLDLNQVIIERGESEQELINSVQKIEALLHPAVS